MIGRGKVGRVLLNLDVISWGGCGGDVDWTLGGHSNLRRDVKGEGVCGGGAFCGSPCLFIATS